MARLPRERKGKTAIDIVAVEQDGLKRVRITMGDTASPNKRNTDMTAGEVRDLITLLEYNHAKLVGKIPWSEGDL